MVNRSVTQEFNIDCYHTAFAFSYAEDFVFRGERHDFWEVKLLKSGGMTVTLEDSVYSLGPGSMIFYAPGAFHREQSEPGTRPEGYTTSFHTTGRLPESLTSGVFKLDNAAVEEYEAIMKPLIDFVNNEESGEFVGQYVSALLSAFLIKLGSTSEGVPRVASRAAQEYNKVASDMAECVGLNLSLSDFAHRAGMSVSYLKLLFAKYAGVSPKAYYTTLRANEAARLLRDGIGVFEVSEKMHFSSPNYFTVFFKRFFQISPQKYKQQQGR